MATVTHYIYSHYDPKQREELERATGQNPEAEEAEEDPWQTESSFGAQRRLATAPRFVPAIVSYDEINNMMGVSEVISQEVEEKPNVEVSSWYKSLTRSSSAPVADDLKPIAPNTAPPSAPKNPPIIHPQSAQVKVAKPTKNDWFISRALRSEPPTGRSTPTQTLADILSRDPPPESSTQSFTPPVFLHLGPSNRGYTMLEKSGWNEGEPLGPRVARRPRGSEGALRDPQREMGKTVVKEEQREVKLDPDGDISELRKVDVIDLTLSDAEDEPEELRTDPGAAEPSIPSPGNTDIPSTHNPRALLTPLPTVLKSDRLGIGLKAKTVGPYKASKKRVTHNQAALAQHIRETEEMRRMKALVGRGSKGFARLAKAEAESRRRLLASLNDPS